MNFTLMYDLDTLVRMYIDRGFLVDVVPFGKKKHLFIKEARFGETVLIIPLNRDDMGSFVEIDENNLYHPIDDLKRIFCNGSKTVVYDNVVMVKCDESVIYEVMSTQEVIVPKSFERIIKILGEPDWVVDELYFYSSEKVRSIISSISEESI